MNSEIPNLNEPDTSEPDDRQPTPLPPEGREPGIRQAVPIDPELLRPNEAEFGEDEEITYATEPVIDPHKRKRDRRGRRGCSVVTLVLGCLLGSCLCCMLSCCALCLGTVSIAAMLNGSESSETSTQTFTIDPDEPVTLNIENRTGQITIQHGGTNDEIEVKYTKWTYANSKSDARARLDDLTVNFDNEGNTLAITVEHNRADDEFFAALDHVEFTVWVPGEVDLTVKNKVGAITVDHGVTVNNLDLHNNTGVIEFHGILPSDPEAELRITTNIGGIVLDLPRSVSLVLSAQADIGDISVATDFQVSNKVGDRDGFGETWDGTLGSAEEDVPTLFVETNVGGIEVNTR